MIDMEQVEKYGIDPETLGNPGFSAKKFVESERVRDLDRFQQYFDCTQHDHKKYDFDGRPCASASSRVNIASATFEVSNGNVPMRNRRPCKPVRLGRTIVNSFTSLLFGEERWPDFVVKDDEEAQDYATAIDEDANLAIRLTEGRNVGGSQGSVGFSWRIQNAHPRVSVHNPKHIHIHAWIDRDELLPSYVIECSRSYEDLWDPKKKAVTRQWFWNRKDWTPVADVVYVKQPYQAGSDPEWLIDEDASGIHNDGFCHFEWVQNLPDSENVDGEPDYEGQLESLDSLDETSSVLARGTRVNLDPTLVLKMDPLHVGKMGIKKGSDNALLVGLQGDAKYLELAGTAVTAGLELMKASKADILEACECIIPNPDDVAAGAVSGVAMTLVYRPMIAKTGILRKQYGRAITRIVKAILTKARQLAQVEEVSTTVPMLDMMGQQMLDPMTNEPLWTEQISQIVYALSLPDRIEENSSPIVDPMTGQDTGEMEIVFTSVPRQPGTSNNLDLTWGEFFPLTPDDQTKIVTLASLATAGKAVMSKETAIEIVATAFGRDPIAEKKRVELGAKQQMAEQRAMVAAGIGGPMPGEGGGKPPGKPGGKFGH